MKESKTKYIKINRYITNLEQDLTMDRQIFEGVQNFRYLGTLINSKYLISDEINSRIVAGNGRFYSLRQTFRSRVLSHLAKVKEYKPTVNPAAVFGSETWTVKRMGAWERKIYGPGVEQGMWRIRTDQELRELCKDLDFTAGFSCFVDRAFPYSLTNKSNYVPNSVSYIYLFLFSTCFGHPSAHHQEKITISMRHWYLSLCMVASGRLVELNPPSRIDATHTE